MAFSKNKYILSFSFLWLAIIGFAQNVPLQDFYTIEVERYVSERPETRSPIHLSMKPFRSSEIENYKQLIQDTNKFYFDVTRKIFKESLLDFSHKKFHVTADPLIDFRIGKENPDTASRFLFQNTRGIRIAGRIGEKFFFETRFYENQARFPDYMESYVNSRGELYPNNNKYYRTNAVIPGSGRTKPFKIDGFDYASAMGYFTVKPFKMWSISFGQDMHFIGNGNRSLLLSDNSHYGPFIRSDLSFFKNRLRLTNIYQGLQNLYRLTEFNTPESTYERKWGTFHYLDYAVTPWLTLGVFEGIVWERSDSLGKKPFQYESIIPVPFVNTAIHGLQDKNNAILGLNIQLMPWRKSIIYAQLMLDDFKTKKYGFQVGWKFFDIFKLDNLYLNIEYNYLTKGAYASADNRHSYSHFNLPLAHPKGSGFQEIIFKARYHFHRVFAHYSVNTYITNDADTNGIATTDIFNVQNQIEPGKQGYVFNQSLELGYRFNRANNFQFYMGFVHRLEDLEITAKPETFYFFIGIRTRFKNFNDDI